MAQEQWYRRLVQLSFCVALAAMGIFFLFPFYWMFKGSFEPSGALLQANIVPGEVTLENYRRLLSDTEFPTFFGNSLVVAVGSTLLTVVLALLGGYGLARFRFPGQATIARSVLLAYMFPALALAIPLFMVFRSAGLVNSYTGLILAHTGHSLPFGIWLMWQFFQTVPRSYEESAFVMGAGRLRAFLDVALPLASPGLVAIAIFAFALSWEDYTFSLILVTQQQAKTLPVGVMNFVERDVIHWGLIQASAVFMALPALLIVLLFQRYLVTGLGAGGLKG